jgi:hypothetical protein
MMLASTVVVVVAATVFFTLFVRMKDIPAPEPVSPTKHLEERKASIYENLRDLQFEYRVGKLSDEDYQQTKQGLQKELAGVIAEMERITASAAAAKPVETPKAKAAAAPKPAAEPGTVCPHCGAKFAKPLKFCGECGKAMVPA